LRTATSRDLGHTTVLDHELGLREQNVEAAAVFRTAGPGNSQIPSATSAGRGKPSIAQPSRRKRVNARWGRVTIMSQQQMQ
jgi:hypothetical protein